MIEERWVIKGRIDVLFDNTTNPSTNAMDDKWFGRYSSSHYPLSGISQSAVVLGSGGNFFLTSGAQISFDGGNATDRHLSFIRRYEELCDRMYKTKNWFLIVIFKEQKIPHNKYTY